MSDEARATPEDLASLGRRLHEASRGVVRYAPPLGARLRGYAVELLDDGRVVLTVVGGKRSLGVVMTPVQAAALAAELVAIANESRPVDYDQP